MVADRSLIRHRDQFAAWRRARLPAIYHAESIVEAGGLISYGPDVIDLYRRAATYADRILEGAKPGDMPVEQPTKFELVINLERPSRLASTPALAARRADEVIE